MLHLKTFCTGSIGWALYGVNFRPLQEIEAIMGGGRIFDTGPFFARLWYAETFHIHVWTVLSMVLQTHLKLKTPDFRVAVQVLPMEPGEEREHILIHGPAAEISGPVWVWGLFARNLEGPRHVWLTEQSHPAAVVDWGKTDTSKVRHCSWHEGGTVLGSQTVDVCECDCRLEPAVCGKRLDATWCGTSEDRKSTLLWYSLSSPDLEWFPVMKHL